MHLDIGELLKQLLLQPLQCRHREGVEVCKTTNRRTRAFFDEGVPPVTVGVHPAHALEPHSDRLLGLVDIGGVRERHALFIVVAPFLCLGPSHFGDQKKNKQLKRKKTEYLGPSHFGN
jgi:hypothetical protein